MPPHLPDDGHHAFLVVRKDHCLGVEQLTEAFRSASPLAQALIRPYLDSVTGTMLFHLWHSANDSDRSAFRVWAAIEGLDLVEKPSWSAPDHRLMVSELDRFDCRRPRNDRERITWSLAYELATACRRAPRLDLEVPPGSGSGDRTHKSDVAPIVHGTIEGLRNEDDNVWDSIELSPSLVRELRVANDGTPQRVEVSPSMRVHVRIADRARARTLQSRRLRGRPVRAAT